MNPSQTVDPSVDSSIEPRSVNPSQTPDPSVERLFTPERLARLVAEARATDKQTGWTREMFEAATIEERIARFRALLARMATMIDPNEDEIYAELERSIDENRPHRPLFGKKNP